MAKNVGKELGVVYAPDGKTVVARDVGLGAHIVSPEYRDTIWVRIPEQPTSIVPSEPPLKKLCKPRSALDI